MRKTLIQLAAASALGAACLTGAQAAPLLFDFDGAGGAGPVAVTAFDWGPTSFVAVGGNAAADVGTGAFTILTHAKMIGYSDANGNYVGLPAGANEITMTASFQETVTGTTANSASFATTGAGWVEMYYGAANSNTLTGFGFNDGRLIGRFNGIQSGSAGAFIVTGGPAVLDQYINNDYTGQQTVTGFGSQSNLTVGTAGTQLDAAFFQSALTSLSLQYANFSIALPYISADPSDCYTQFQSTGVVGAAAAPVVSCNNAHVNGLMSAQGGPGYIPNIGVVNGAGGLSAPGAPGGPDFVAQTDFNSPVAVTAIPEPASLALMGLALFGVGAASRRRRS